MSEPERRRGKATDAGPTAVRMTSRSNAESDAETVVRDFMAAWSRLDADELASYFTEDGVYHNMPAAPVAGRAAVRDFIAGFSADWVETDWEIHTHRRRRRSRVLRARRTARRRRRATSICPASACSNSRAARSPAGATTSTSARTCVPWAERSARPRRASPISLSTVHHAGHHRLAHAASSAIVSVSFGSRLAASCVKPFRRFVCSQPFSSGSSDQRACSSRWRP